MIAPKATLNSGKRVANGFGYTCTRAPLSLTQTDPTGQRSTSEGSEAFVRIRRSAFQRRRLYEATETENAVLKFTAGFSAQLG